MLAQHHEVMALDIVPAKVDLINARQSPIEEADIHHYQATRTLNLRATLDKSVAYQARSTPVISSIKTE